ncbi:coiled-coil domain-containing protein 170-like isoform X2 [Fukomys damarensis]|nr:coiled-coil domain-containing protein 170-like isoform X2 [Fukomys damarensis]
MNCTKAADHPGFAGLLMKNKNVLSELRTLQRKLFREETSLRETKTELARYKEQQSFQIMSLRDDVKGLQEFITSLTRMKSLKDSNIQSLERGNWDLAKRVTELENLLRVLLAEREKGKQKADFLMNKLSRTSRFPPVNIKGQEDPLDIFLVKEKGKSVLAREFETEIIHSEGPNDVQKVWDKCQQDVFHEEKQTSELDGPPYSCSQEVKTARSQYQDFLSQLDALLSDSSRPIPATEDTVKERIQEIGANEQSWKYRAEGLQQKIQKLIKRLEQLYQIYEEPAHTGENYRERNRLSKCLEGNIAMNDCFQGKLDLDKKKLISTKESSMMQNFLIDKHNKFKHLDMLLDIQQNLQVATTLRLEDKIQKLQKQLSDLKLSNKTMKTQLSRVNILKDKTLEKLRKSLKKVETMKEKAAAKTDNLKTTVDSTKQEAQSEKERARDGLRGVSPERSMARSALGEASRQERELADFREMIMRILGWNMKTADKEIINQLKLIIQVYEITNKSKIASACEKGQDKK